MSANWTTRNWGNLKRIQLFYFWAQLDEIWHIILSLCIVWNNYSLFALLPFRIYGVFLRWKAEKFTVDNWPGYNFTSKYFYFFKFLIRFCSLKHFESIPNFGALSALCFDTESTIIVWYGCNGTFCLLFYLLDSEKKWNWNLESQF